MTDEKLSRIIEYVYNQGYLDCMNKNGLMCDRDYNDATAENWKKANQSVDYGEDYLKSLRRGDGDGGQRTEEDARYQSAG